MNAKKLGTEIEKAKTQKVELQKKIKYESELKKKVATQVQSLRKQNQRKDREIEKLKREATRTNQVHKRKQ
jgi:chromosome segregation ATPase